MTKAEYYEIRGQLSFEPPLLVTLGVLAVDALLVAVAICGLLGFAGTTGYWLAQPLLALFYFHNFAILHECGHGNVHRKGWVNALIGHYCSLFCFLPYFPWKFIHSEHHVWTGHLDKDPTLKKVRQMKRAGRVPWIARVAWRSWVPVAGLLQHTVFWLYPIDAWRNGSLRGGRVRQSASSVALLGVALTAWILWAPSALSFSAIWPSFVLYLVAVELVNLPHHAGMPTYDNSHERKKLHLWEQHHSTRSCRYPGVLSDILTLNFNLHTEHHFFPTLPWFRLKTARDLLSPKLRGDYHEEKGFNWNLENRHRDAQEVLLDTPKFPV